MSNKNNEHRKVSTSCGAATWRVANGEVEILLIKQFENSDSWGIPKGHMDAGETFEECAVREVHEETGVLVKLGTRLPNCFTSFKHEDKTVVSYLAVPVGSHECQHDDPDNEVADAKWWPIKQLPKIHVYQHALLAHIVEHLTDVD